MFPKIFKYTKYLWKHSSFFIYSWEYNCIKKLIMVNITRKRADKLSSRNPKLKFNELFMYNQLITSLLMKVPVLKVTNNKQIE